MITIVVLHHGDPALVLECLKSIEMADQRRNIEVVLVDNGSSNHDHARLRDGLNVYQIEPNRLIRLSANVGFSRGMNAGIEVAAGSLVIALNSDTLVGKKLPALLMRHAAAPDSQVGFYAVPVFDARRSEDRMEPTTRLQSEVTALTWYISCLPVRRDEIASRYILGPSGCAVVITRDFVRHMLRTYGFVYNPEFFLYGEDVDLFLQARREGFRTEMIEANIECDEVIWHLGSGTSSTTGVRTLDKSPEVAAGVLAGCVRNTWFHARTFELIPLLFLQLCFRLGFCALYWRRHSWREVRPLMFAGIPPRLVRSSRQRSEPFVLSSLIAMLYRRPGFWARGWKTSSRSGLKKRWAERGASAR